MFWITNKKERNKAISQICNSEFASNPIKNLENSDTLIMTTKELAEYCECSKIPINRQLAKIKLRETYKFQLGKEVKAYIITKSQLKTMKTNIRSNKKKMIKCSKRSEKKNIFSIFTNLFKK